MKLFTYRTVMTGRFFALLVATSMILSTLPVSFLLAEATAPAPVTLFSDDFESGLGAWSSFGSWTIIGPGGGSDGSKVRATGSGPTGLLKVEVPTVGYENIQVSFRYRGNLNGSDTINSTYTVTPPSTIGAGIFNASNAGDSTWHTANMALTGGADNNPNFTLQFTGILSASSDQFDVDTVVITGTPMSLPACAPQFDVAGPTDVQNLDTFEYFNSIQDAIDDCDTVSGHTISLTDGRTTSQQITFTKEIALNGNGNTLSPTFTKTNNSNNSVIGVQADNVTIRNLVIDGSGGTQLHGVNVYQSTGVLLDTLSFTDINRSAVVVNASDVTINNISTSNSGTESVGWKVIDVDPKSATASLVVNGTSAHDEALPRAHIWAENPDNVTITDTNNQYDMVSFPIFGGDRYRLKTPTTGSITIAKRVNDESGNTTNFYFGMHSPILDTTHDSGGSPIYSYNFDASFTLTGGDTTTYDDLTPDLYTITENDIPSDWNLSGVSCDSGGNSIFDYNIENNEVAVTLTAGDSVECTFNNEIEKVAPQPCVVEIVSDGSDFVTETNSTAQPLSFIHNAWTAVINGASWIWGDDPVADTSVDVTQTFVKNFGFVGNITNATLEVASDNSNTVDLNGTNVATVGDLNNFKLATQDSYDVTGLVSQGNNELAIAVTNKGINGSSARSNPAGLLYKLTIEGTETDVAGCAIPYEEPMYTIAGYKWNDANGDGQWGEERPVSKWGIALRPMNMEPVEELEVPSNGDTVTTSNVLEAGKTYVVEVSGTYRFANWGEYGIADAEWAYRNDSFTDSPLASHGWTVGELTYPPAYDAAGLDIQIDGNNINWGSFNGDNLYKTILEGNDATLDFSIYDSYYGDNEGSLSVKIYDVTDYAMYTDGDGYYSFTVPAGEYQIIEQMDPEWTQTYPANPSYYHVTIPNNDDQDYNFGNMRGGGTPEPTGSISVLKHVIGGPLGPDAFQFHVWEDYVDQFTESDSSQGDWVTEPTFFTSNGENTVPLPYGQYDIREAGVPADYTVTYDGCTDLDVSAENAPTCVITNTYTPPIACVANVNLLENPSFEAPVVTASRKWDMVNPVGWIVRALSNNALVDMEIQRGVFGWLPSDGDQITELDTNKNVRIKQVIDTIPGESYTLTWDYSARPGTSAPDSKMIVRVNGDKVATNNEDGVSNTSWMSNSYSFIANSNETRIAFIGKGSSNGLGALLDNTSLECIPAEPEIPYGPYCGDGEINQEWEQNEVGDEGYNGTCQPEVPTQCTDLRLVKINLDDNDSVSFDNRIYLGSATNPIPSGVWFNFDDLGDNTVNTIATTDNGLAVSRDTSNNRLILGLRGGNDSGEIDIASGNIETMGIVLGAVNRNPIVGWPLENGSGSTFLDVFQKNGDSTAVTFDMRADTGRDAVSVGINAGKPYNCPLPDPTFEVSGIKWNDENGDGEQGENESGISGWTIEITDGDTTLSTTTDENGQYSFNVPEGFWAVSEVMQKGWNQTGLISSGRYGYADDYVYDDSENPSKPIPVSCEFNVGGYVPETTVARSLSIAPESLYSCDFGNQQTPDTKPEVVIDTVEHNYGTRFSRGPVGQVLGISTTAGQCGIYLDDFMKEGISNNPVEVYKLQAFLIGQGMDLTMTGVFDDATDAAVRAFQLKYKSDVLTPWYTAGIASNENSTGYVYLTTKWKINDLMCPEIAPFPNLFEE